MSNREIIEWLRKKAETMPMPGARKMYEAAAKALEAAQPELGTNLAEDGTDLISRAEAQTELQLSARRYTVAHEAHGEGRVVWSEDLISVSDAMDVLRKMPPAEPEIIRCRDCKYNATSKKCLNPNSFFLVPADDDFCSYAERREDE